MQQPAFLAGLILLFSAAWSSASADIRCVQSALARLGHAPGPVDGLIGERTLKAARAFAAAADADLPEFARETSVEWCEALRERASHLPRFDVVSRPPGVLSARDTQRLWGAYKRAKACFDHPIYGEGERLRIKRFTAAELARRTWVNPFTPAATEGAGREPLPRIRLGEPIGTVRLDERYGQRVAEVDAARDRFIAMINRVRTGLPGASAELRDAVRDWARADAFARGIRVSWGHKPVDWQVMTAIMSFVTAAGTIADTLGEDEKAIVGPWLNRLVAESADSRWKDRQDNKAYMKTYMAMLWGLMIGDDQAVQKAIDTFKLAMHDMRPDGSMPIDTQRGGMGLKYNSDSVSYLVMMAALLRANTGQDLFAYEADGRSLHDAVEFVVRSIRSPRETNRLYAIRCPEGGDRWGSVDIPNTHFISSATYLLVYASMFPDAPDSQWITGRYGRAAATPMETFGGVPVQLFDFQTIDGG